MLGLGLGITFFKSAGPSTPVPVLSSIDFDVALSRGGASIALSGSDLGDMMSTVTIDPGGVHETTATITANDGSALTFTMPAIASGTYNVVVTTDGGTSNALTIEAWMPGDEASCTLFVEKPNYTYSAGSGGTWAATTGGDLTHAAPAPSAVSGGPVFNGSTDRLNSASDLKDLMSTTEGSVFVAVKPTAHPLGGAVYNNPLFVSNTGNSTFGLSLVDSGSGVDYYYLHLYDGTYKFSRVAAAYNVLRSIVARFENDATLELSVDGLDDSGTPGFESTAIGTWNASYYGGSLDVGGNYDSSAYFTGEMDALAIFSTKVTDDVATKWNKVCRCEYGTP